MSAQPASSIVLAYGPQGARQAAGAVVLDYSATAGRRRIATTFGAPWAKATPRSVQARAVMHATATLDPTRRAPWAQGHAQQRESRSAWVLSNHAECAVLVPWLRFATRLQRDSRTPWPTAHTAERAAQSTWGRYAGCPALTAVAPWVRAQVSDPQASAPWGRYAGRPDRTAVAAWARSRPADALRWVPWVRFGRPLDAGWGVVVPPGSVTDPFYEIPLLKVYMATHFLSAVLLSTLEPVKLLGATIESDDGGFGWSLSADGPETLLDQLAPVGGLPARVRVTIDGIDWVFAIERIGRTRRFGQHRASVQGRSVTALLGDPYMPQKSWLNTSASNAQQLVAQALEFTGTTIAWGIDDWLVPAGVWSFQGTPLQAAQRVADSVGAVLRSHRTNEQLVFAPRYPVLPWDWSGSVLDVQMPAAIITTDDLQSDSKPAYNAVYVNGMAQGVRRLVRRAGTAGDLLATQVTDALITADVAARQRGSAVLGAAGKKLTQTMTLPLLMGTGGAVLIEPGYLIEVADIGNTWRGLVRGIRIVAGMPVVRQTITVERSA